MITDTHNSGIDTLVQIILCPVSISFLAALAVTKTGLGPSPPEDGLYATSCVFYIAWFEKPGK